MKSRDEFGKLAEALPVLVHETKDTPNLNELQLEEAISLSIEPNSETT